MTSPENIIFKYLARYGYLYVYFHLKRLLEDDERITEDEVEQALQILRERMSSLRVFRVAERFEKDVSERWATPILRHHR